MTSPRSMHEAGHSKLVHWDHPEGWEGAGGRGGWDRGTHVHPWLIHVSVWQKPQYGKVISLRLKQINKFKKNKTEKIKEKKPGSLKRKN